MRPCVAHATLAAQHVESMSIDGLPTVIGRVLNDAASRYQRVDAHARSYT